MLVGMREREHAAGGNAKWWIHNGIWFIHSSTNRALDCFYFLVMNNAAVNTCVQMFVYVSDPLEYISNISGSYGDSMFKWWGIFHTAFQSCCHIMRFHQPRTGVPTFHTLINTYYKYFLIIVSWQVWSNISLWIWCAFPRWLMTLDMSAYVYWPFAYVLWENSLQILWPFYKLGDWSFYFWVVRVLYILVSRPMSGIYLEISHPVDCLFTFLVVSLWRTKDYNFNNIPFNFLFCCLCFWCRI